MPYYNAHNYVTTYLFDNVVLDLDSVLPVTCSDVVTLSARVSGDLTGHTFEWSQLSGTPVIWLESVNQTSVMFQQPAARDDKVFRFTIDKGTAVAKYKDILVTAVPTDTMTSYIGQTNTIGSFSLSSLTTELSYLYQAPAIREAGAVNVNDTTKAVLFSSPNQFLLTPGNNYSVNLVVKSGNSYNLVSNNPISDATYNGISYINGVNLDSTYKLQAVIGSNTQDSVTFSTSTLAQQYNGDIGIHDESVLSPSISDNKTTSEILETISRSLVSLNIDEIEDQYTSMLYSTGSNSEILETISRTLIGLDVDDIEDVMAVSILDNSVKSEILEIKSYTYSSLG